MASAALTLLLIQQWSLVLPELPATNVLWIGSPLALAGLWYQNLRWLAVTYLLVLYQLEALHSLPNPRDMSSRAHSLVRIRGEVTSLIRDEGEFLSYRVKVFSAIDSKLIGHQLSVFDRQAEHAKQLDASMMIEATIQLAPLAGHFNFHPRYDRESAFYRGVTGRASMIRLHHAYQSRFLKSSLPIRQRYSHWINAKIDDSRVRPVIKALTIGRTDFLETSDQWLLQKTATAHLLVISGLHMGLVGWGSFRAFRYLGVSLRLSLAFASLVVMHYAWLATVDVSVIRSGFMFCFLIAASLIRLPRSSWGIFWLTLLATLLVSPTISGLTGFWFSFGCVAILLLLTRPTAQESFGMLLRVFLTVRVQLALGLAILPITAYFLGTSSMIGPLVNVIAIPFIAFIVLPVSIITLLLFLSYDLLELFWVEQSAVFSLTVAEAVILAFWLLIDQAGMLSQTIDLPKLPVVYLLMMTCAFLMVLSGLRWVHWTIVIALCAPLIVPKVWKPKLGELKLLIMDVGQGTSVLVQTAHHYLLFDAGPRTRRGFDAGEKVVLPQLRGLGVPGISQLIISHDDADHVGGRAVLESRFQIKKTITSNSQACLQGYSFRLDEINFRYSKWQQAQTQNDGSCQLIIEGSNYKILLAGDIGLEAELALMPRLPTNIDLLLAPHHGSRSSSSPALLNQLMPKWVVFSAGADNSFGHPHPEIVARYFNRGSRILFTAQQGAVEFGAGRSGLQLSSTARSEYRRFWLPLR